MTLQMTPTTTTTPTESGSLCVDHASQAVQKVTSMYIFEKLKDEREDREWNNYFHQIWLKGMFDHVSIQVIRAVLN